MRTILLLTIILRFATFTNAQTLIQGTVSDIQEKKGIESVNVTIQDKDNNSILGFTLTDKEGKYRIEYRGQKDSLVLTASGFNVKKQSKTVVNKSQTVDFEATFESITLKEVKITPPNIRQRGDTISYTVSNFTDKSDRTIEDVLKKLPGIDVKESGQILYQNIPINKFYIEGLDLLQGRYGLATRNIEAKDVQNVEVFENHQAIKALRDKIFSEQAAINLKLKESAKGVLTSNALVGAGLPPLLKFGEVTAMYFSKSKQNITTYKGNNAGYDVSADQRQFYSFDSNIQSNSGLLSVQSPSSPPTSQRRYLYNETNIFSFNNLWKPSTDYQINTNVNYLNDRIDKSSFASTEYFLLNNEYVKIEETLNSRSYNNRANVDIQLNGNKEKFYLDNKLRFEGVWDSERGNAINRDTIRQILEKPKYGISNSFELIKNYEKTTLRITSDNSFSTLPHNLTVEPVLYGNLFDVFDGAKAMRQNVYQPRS